MGARIFFIVFFKNIIILISGRYNWVLKLLKIFLCSLLAMYIFTKKCTPNNVLAKIVKIRAHHMKNEISIFIWIELMASMYYTFYLGERGSKSFIENMTVPWG